MSDFLVSFLGRSLVLGCAGCIALFLVRRRSASMQHFVTISTLVGMLCLPLLTISLPRQEVRLPIAHAVVQYLEFKPVALQVHTAKDQAPFDWRTPAEELWAAGSILLLARLIVGFSRLNRRIKRSMPIEIAGFGTEVRIDPAARAPMMAWCGRNVVLLPADWNEWPAERARRILRHEEAHAKRGDWFSLIACQVACAFLWPNPFVWLMSRLARRLAEQAADDQVLEAGAEPSSYANDLLDFARGSEATFPSLALPMAAKAEVAWRIEMILNKNRKRGHVGLNGLLIGGSLLGVTSGSIAMLSLGTPPQVDAKDRKTSIVYPNSQHAKWVKSGIACTDCHRTNKNTPLVGSAYGETSPIPIEIQAKIFRTMKAFVVAGKAISSVTPELVRPGKRSALVIVVPAKNADWTIAEVLKAGEKMISSPTLKTLSGTNASIDIAGGNGAAAMSFKITPSAKAEGAINLDFKLMITSGHGPLGITNYVWNGTAYVEARTSTPQSSEAHGVVAVTEDQAVLIIDHPTRGSAGYLTVLRAHRVSQ